MDKILVVAPSWVGDLVMSQALYRQLKIDRPNAEIHLLTPAWCKDITARMPEVSKTIEMPIGHGKLQILARYQLAQTLKKASYTQAIILPNSLKSALIPWLARIPKRTGFKGEMRYGLLNDLRHLNKSHLPLMVQRFAALAHEKNANIDINNVPKPLLKPEKADAILSKYKLNTNHPIVVFAPGAAFGNSKQWPSQHFAELAEDLLSRGMQIWLMASPKERLLVDAINQMTGSRCKTLTEPSLREKVDLMALAKGLVSNDSGLLHIGCALNIAVVGLFGSTSTDFTPPLGDNAIALQIEALSCRPCFKRSCPMPAPDTLRCLTDITPKRVLDNLTRLMV